MRMCAARRNYAAVQLKRTEFLVRCFSLIYSFLVDSHGRRSARTPRHPEWCRHAPTRPRPRDDRTTPHLPHSAFESPTVQLRGPECTPPCSCYRMKACIAQTHGNSSGITAKKSSCMLSQPLRLSFVIGQASTTCIMCQSLCAVLHLHCHIISVLGCSSAILARNKTIGTRPAEAAMAKTAKGKTSWYAPRPV